MSEYAKQYVETLPDGELPKLLEIDVDDLRYALRVIGQFSHARTEGFQLLVGNGIVLRDEYGHWLASGWDGSAHAIMELPPFVPAHDPNAVPVSDVAPYGEREMNEPVCKCGDIKACHRYGVRDCLLWDCRCERYVERKPRIVTPAPTEEGE